MTKHTPTPWSIEEVKPNKEFIVCTVGTQNYSVCGLYVINDEDIEIAKWDAKLIAAAPELLEALQNIENDDNSIPPHVWSMIKGAISKATK